MLYMMGSKMYKAVVVFAAGAFACGGGAVPCSGHGDSGAAATPGNNHTGSGHTKINPNHISDSELDRMDDSGDEVDPKMDFATTGHDGEAGAHDHPPAAPPQKPSPPSDEEIANIRSVLGLTDEDVETINGYVKEIPKELKDPDFNDQEIAKMFIKHYAGLSDEDKYEPQSREDLLDEIKHLVEVELPKALNGDQPQPAEAEVPEQAPAEPAAPSVSEEEELDNLDDEEPAQQDL